MKRVHFGWVEAKSLAMAIEKSVTNFLYEDIYTRFGVPQEIVIDRGEQFTSNAMKYLVEQYKIKH